MQYETVILEKEGNIATLYFNRPDKMNALNPQMREDLVAALAEVNKDDDIRVLIVTGAGDRAFNAGADIGMFGAKIAGEEQGPTRSQITELKAWYMPLFRELRVPTIAAMNGVAVGIGVSFALICDIRVASDKARISCGWVNRGVTPDGGALHLLPKLIGIEKALELLYTGEMTNAEEMLRIGLVSRVVPHEDLMKASKELAGKIAAGPPISLELIKRGVHRFWEADLQRAIDYETYAANICLSTEDHKEGVMSFVEKRQAEFKGR